MLVRVGRTLLSARLRDALPARRKCEQSLRYQRSVRTVDRSKAESETESSLLYCTVLYSIPKCSSSANRTEQLLPAACLHTLTAAGPAGWHPTLYLTALQCLVFSHSALVAMPGCHLPRSSS